MLEVRGTGAKTEATIGIHQEEPANEIQRELMRIYLRRALARPAG